jgi:hypothetical protein
VEAVPNDAFLSEVARQGEVPRSVRQPGVKRRVEAPELRNRRKHLTDHIDECELGGQMLGGERDQTLEIGADGAREQSRCGVAWTTVHEAMADSDDPIVAYEQRIECAIQSCARRQAGCGIGVAPKRSRAVVRIEDCTLE